MSTAALGGEIEVPTIDAHKARVKIPEGTQSGKQFRLKGKGMTMLRSSGKGDMYIQALLKHRSTSPRSRKNLWKSLQALKRSPTPAPFLRVFLRR